MGFTRVMRAVGGTALAGALLLAAAPTASADQVRSAEWPLTAFKADQVWQSSTGKGVTVAVIDSGVDANHPDLSGQVLPGTDFVHNGGNGQHDYSSEGHGTGMASIIAGHGHGPGNTDGVMGVAPGAKILPIAIPLLQDGTAASSDAPAMAIRFAVDHGASVINMSIAGPIKTPSEEAAVGYAEAHNVILVAGSGNEVGDTVQYPAGYPGVVSVGAVDQSATVASFSGYGPGVTLTAPGVDIVNADGASSTGYSMVKGTSPATAYVSGTAALLRAKFPNLTAGQIINRMIKTASHDNLAGSSGSVPDAHYGYGVVRPLRALTDNVPAGPAQGPLSQVSSANPGSGAGSGDNSATTPTPSKSSSHTGTIVGVVIGTLVVIAIIVALALISRRRKNNSGGGPGTPGGGAPGGQYPNYPQYGQPQAPQQPYQPPTSNNPYGGSNQPR